MASSMTSTTVTTANLSDGTNSTSSTNCIRGGAKAWANFNGTNGSIRASYNVSSVTRSAVGIYVLTFTSAMADVNYSFLCTGNGYSATDAGASTAKMAGSGSVNGYANAPTALSTTSIQLLFGESGGSRYDTNYYCVAVFR